MIKAVAYYRTSSATNVGPDKDSEQRQRDATHSYASRSGIEIAGEFYDAAVSGADPVTDRPGFVALLARCVADPEIKTILVENASRFARDLTVQLTGHALLKQRGLELIPVDAPTYFTDPSPTAVMIQQILGAVSQFEKSSVVSKLRHARDRVREKSGRCEGRPPAPEAAKTLARYIRERNPNASLRQIANALARDGFLSPYGNPYSPSSIKIMLKLDSPRAEV